MTTIHEIAATIADRQNMTHDAALTLATSYAIQLDVDCHVQEGGQAPNVEVDTETEQHILAAAAIHEDAN